MSISRFKRSSAISLLLLLIFITLQLSASPLNQHGVAILNPPLISINATLLNGTLYQIYQQICSSLNINATFETQSIKKLNESLPKILANTSSGIDFVLGYPVLPDDLTFDLTYENVSKIQLLQEEMYIFKPNLLQALVINVLREMFFVLIIILLPWFLVNMSLFYLIEIRKFYKMDFFQGLYQSLRSILYIRTQMSKCAQVYSLVFYLLTAIITMLLLGDFIYVIAAMLLRSSDVDNINDLVNTTSKACFVDGDYLILDFLSTREEIAKIWAPDILTCFTKLSTFDAGSFLISEYKIKDYFMRHPKQNNIFDFILKDSVSLTYYLLVRTSSGLATPIENVMNNLNQLYIPELEVLEFKDPVFNKISPSSIFSDSILLIFTSLTITSIFLIFFLVVLICKQKRRSRTKHIRMRDRSDKKEKKERKDKKNSKHKSNRKHVEEKKYELARQSERNPAQRAIDDENPEYIERRHNGLTDQNVHQRQGHKATQSQQNPNGRNNIRNTNNNHINNGGNNNHGSVNNNANNNKTLSLSGGPIQLKKFEGRPEKSWLKIDAQSSRAEGSFKFQGTSDFENQLSPVEKADDTVKSKHEFDLDGVDHEGNK